MAQRNSGYKRVDADYYPTPGWVTRALIEHSYGGLLTHDHGNYHVWEPAAGENAIVDELKQYGFRVWGTDIRGHPSVDFLDDSVGLIRPHCNCIITNPPYRRDLIEGFIRKSLELMEAVNGRVSMLLRIDFDSAITRSDIFGDCKAWYQKLVLTKRIKWFDDGNKNGPSENHAWYTWDWSKGNGRPTIIYGH